MLLAPLLASQMLGAQVKYHSEHDRGICFKIFWQAAPIASRRRTEICFCRDAKSSHKHKSVLNKNEITVLFGIKLCLGHDKQQP